MFTFGQRGQNARAGRSNVFCGKNSATLNEGVRSPWLNSSSWILLRRAISVSLAMSWTKGAIARMSSGLSAAISSGERFGGIAPGGVASCSIFVPGRPQFVEQVIQPALATVASRLLLME